MKAGNKTMLAAKGLLESLSMKEEAENYKDCNDDHDFGKVLDFYGSSGIKTAGHKLRYSDGQEKAFSFDS